MPVPREDTAPMVVSQSGSIPSIRRPGPRYGATGGLINNMRDGALSAVTGGNVNDHRVFMRDVEAERARLARRSSGGGGGGGGYTAGLSGIASLSQKAATDPYDRALKQLGLDYGNNRSQTALQGRRQDADLAELFARLGRYTGNLKGLQAGSYDANAKALGSNYDSMLKAVQGGFQKGVGNTTNELQRLGIQEVSPAAMAGLAQDGSHMLAQGRIDKANSLQNNSAQKALFNSLMTEMMGAASVEGASQRGKAKQATQDALTQLLNDFVKGKNDLSGKRADALMQARLQAAQQAFSARQRALSSSRRGSSGSEDKPRKPTGYNDAVMQLMNLSGGDRSKFTDYKNELDFLLSKPTDPRTQKPVNNYDHLTKNWGASSGRGVGMYGKQGVDALLEALAIANKRY